MVFFGSRRSGGPHGRSPNKSSFNFIIYSNIITGGVYFKKRSHTNEKFKSEVIDMTDD